MLGKYILDRGVGPSPLRKVQVWVDNGHCTQSVGTFLYDPEWWKEQEEMVRRQVGSYGVPQTLEDALRRARELYDSLPDSRAPSGTIAIGRRLD